MIKKVNLTKKKALKVLLAAVVVCALIVGCVLLYNLLRPKKDTLVIDKNIVFSTVDYDYNIFDDVVYRSKSRDLMYQSYGVTELVTDSNKSEFGPSSRLFLNYFDTVINGRFDDYRKLFTQFFFKHYRIPQKFTMQKIYDINVRLMNQSRDEKNDGAYYEYYEVNYKIMNNNGTFRGDVPSNIERSVCFELYVTDEEALINGIDFIN